MVDDEIVILCFDHPFILEGPVGSLLVRDAALAARLAEGFEELTITTKSSTRAIKPGHLLHRLRLATSRPQATPRVNAGGACVLDVVGRNCRRSNTGPVVHEGSRMNLRANGLLPAEVQGRYHPLVISVDFLSRL